MEILRDRVVDALRSRAAIFINTWSRKLPDSRVKFSFGKPEDVYSNTVPPREQLGFVADGVGYGFMINTWTGTAGLRDGNWDTLGTDVGHNSNTNGDWTPVRIEVRENGIVVFWNEAELYREAVSIDSEYNTVGFSAGTGYYTMEVRLKDISYSSL